MVERRAEEEIVHAWITLLEMLHLCPTGATTKKLAALANQPIDQTRRDLNSLRKKGLVQSRKEGRQLLWYLHSPQGGQHAFWKNGKVVVKPDLAIMNFSVVNEAEDVQEAMDKNSEKMNAVIDYLKDQGIKQADVIVAAMNLTKQNRGYFNYALFLTINSRIWYSLGNS